jgi:hypothetical protein
MLVQHTQVMRWLCMHCCSGSLQHKQRLLPIWMQGSNSKQGYKGRYSIHGMVMRSYSFQLNLIMAPDMLVGAALCWPTSFLLLLLPLLLSQRSSSQQANSCADSSSSSMQLAVNICCVLEIAPSAAGIACSR